MPEKAGRGVQTSTARGYDSQFHVFMLWCVAMGYEWPQPLRFALLEEYMEYITYECDYAAGYPAKFLSLASTVADQVDSEFFCKREPHEHRLLKAIVQDAALLSPGHANAKHAIPEAHVTVPRMLQLALEEDEAVGIVFAARFLLILNCGCRGDETTWRKLHLSDVYITTVAGHVTAVRLHIYFSKANKRSAIPEIKIIRLRADGLDAMKPFLRFLAAVHGVADFPANGVDMPLITAGVKTAPISSSTASSSSASAAALLVVAADKEDAPLFAKMCGGSKYTDVQAFAERLLQLAAKAGLPEAKVKALGAHSLRRTFKSLATAAGVLSQDTSAACFWSLPEEGGRDGNRKRMAGYDDSGESAPAVWERINDAIGLHLQRLAGAGPA